MTLEEATIHSREVAKEKRSEGCYECANEHEQLAAWLEELKTLRKAYAMACEEIEDRTCKYYLCTDNCKSFCELYDACAGNIEYEDYFLKKERENNDNSKND